MKIGVVGLWHLGCVTAACLAKLDHTVTAYDEDAERIAEFKQKKLPVYEPNLLEYISEAEKKTKLSFSDDPASLGDLEIIWVTYDTPVDSDGLADVKLIKDRLIKLFPYFKEDVLLIISSQLPVGTTREMKTLFQKIDPDKKIRLVYSPENLRLGSAIARFMNPDRVVMGVESEDIKAQIKKLLYPIADKIIWMSMASAEMTKHAINTFLATSIVFINELATLCQALEVDIKSVEKGLKTDKRIGPLAYLSAGSGFSGSTLMRDVTYLLEASHAQQVSTPLFEALLASNRRHSDWVQQKLLGKFKQLKGKKIAILGLAYKPGTNALQHSLAVRVGVWLDSQGAVVSAYDPLITSLSTELATVISLQNDLASAFNQADAVVIGAECPEFVNTDMKRLIATLLEPNIFDIGGLLSQQLKDVQGINYYTLGASHAVT
ncbi:nucleotide sugar dehydrogenase [Rickettsiella endosymbiont of Dermanyssus gallinae]|uniref:nucleotide sugar dehydrogenase n=1 Tax=Rickettsiella endosymbiont of Dermanyssus gallinae TaxID=2856608 RepID=UPI001C52F7E1|nr:nucleotide sugar dehydrogenase [Rickettsiella endosymbiont of Dermanyssus gallinae]